MTAPSQAHRHVLLTVAATDGRVRVRRLVDAEVVRTSCVIDLPEPRRVFPRLLVPPLLDPLADDAAVFVADRDGKVHYVPLDGRPATSIEGVRWSTERPSAVAGDGRALAVDSQIVTATGARHALGRDGAKVGAITSAPDGFLVASAQGRDWTCERVVVTPEGLVSRWSVSWRAPIWLQERSPAIDAKALTRIAPQLSESQPLVMLLPSSEPGAPWIERVAPNGERMAITREWFDDAEPAVIADDVLHYFSFGTLRRVALLADAKAEDGLDLDAIIERVGGEPGQASGEVRAISRDGRAALVRVDGLPDGGAAREFAAVMESGASVWRLRLPGEELPAPWLLPARGMSV